MQRILIVIGLLIVVIGLTWPWLSQLPFGRLPGDIIIDRPGVKIYIPIVTMILISALISLLIWIFNQ